MSPKLPMSADLSSLALPDSPTVRLPFQKQLTVILSRDPSSAIADADVAALTDKARTILRLADENDAYFWRLRVRAAKDPSLIEKIAVFYRDNDDVLHEVKLDDDYTKEMQSWPVGFANEIWHMENEVKTARWGRRLSGSSRGEE